MASIIFKMRNEYAKLSPVATEKKKNLFSHMKSYIIKNGSTQGKQDLVFHSTHIFTAESSNDWEQTNTIL